MYEAFYGLREKPFSIQPDPDIIYWGSNHRLAFSVLEYSIINNAGFAVITGEIGSGKTTLVRALLRRLDPNINVGLISNTPQGRDELLQWIMMALGQPFEGSYSNLFFRFQQHLRAQHSLRRRTVLIIDEAQNLQTDSLEALRMLSNINVDKEQFLQLILVGQPQLKDLLGSPHLVQFAQRIAADFHLLPLNPAEVTEYIDFRLAAVGAHTTLFSQQACDLIASASHGIPRTINVICDTALVYGYGTQASWIDENIVKNVIEHRKTYGIFRG